MKLFIIIVIIGAGLIIGLQLLNLHLWHTAPLTIIPREVKNAL